MLDAAYGMARKWLEKPRIGVLSAGRLDDVGSKLWIDEIIREGDTLAAIEKEEGSKTKHYGILLEDALRECYVIMAPDGVSGNMIFRSLSLVGGSQGLGAPVLNIDGLFVDTSRAKKNYLGAITLAAALSQ